MQIIKHYEPEKALGIFVAICIERDAYQDWTIQGISRLFLPPIRLAQYGVIVDGSNNVGFFTWALLSKEASEYIKKTREDPRPYEWNSGQELWVIDFVCKDGMASEIIHLLRSTSFLEAAVPGISAKPLKINSFRRKPGGIVKQVTWHTSAVPDR